MSKCSYSLVPWPEWELIPSGNSVLKRSHPELEPIPSAFKCQMEVVAAKWKNTPRQKIGTSSLTACSQYAHKCSQHAHKCSQHAHKWSQTLQTPVKWPKKTLTLLGRSQHAHSMVLERSLSFKFIQSHSKSRQFPPSITRLVFDWLPFNVIQIFSSQIAPSRFK